MIKLQDPTAEDYPAAWREQLDTCEAGLLSLEDGGAEVDGELIEGVFRAVQAVRTGAGFYNLAKIGELAQQAEDVLAIIRSGKLVPTPPRVSVLLNAVDELRGMIQHAATSNRAEIGEVMSALAKLLREAQRMSVGNTAAFGGRPESWRLRMLLVEDDFTSRLMLQTFLSRYGECHVAVNGREAVDAVQSALAKGQRYDLICMDIMMPEMDGREAVRRIRALEQADGILWNRGAKIIMTTAVNNIREVFQCFLELCDAYLVKPIDLSELLSKMKSYELVQ